MAEERQVKPAVSQPAGGRGKDAPKIPTEITEIRKALVVARREHALQKLDTPSRLKALRTALARALTKERQAALQKEQQRG